MAQSCSRCGRANPDEAIYCHHDGGVLAGRGPAQPLHTSLRPFVRPLLFPSGQPCQNFEQLLRCCQEDWASAVTLMRRGELEQFFIGLGRIDLAQTARSSAMAADPDRGLDELLGRLPSQTPLTPRLSVTPLTLDLGTLRAGEDRRFEITLGNEGARLLYGSATSDSVWLTLGDAAGTNHKVFQFSREQTMAVWVRGGHLHASRRPLEARLVVESNAGSATVMVLAVAPPETFTQGVLAGAGSPRELVEKVRANPRGAVDLFDSGAVADWYRRNNWPYPVPGPSAAGLDGVRQFFKALGLPDELSEDEPAALVVPAIGGPSRRFPDGVLAGATDPRQLIDKARAAPLQAAPFFDSGAVAAWYEANGWTYPVAGPRALGIDAVYQFLASVGAAPAPVAVLVGGSEPPAPLAPLHAIPSAPPEKAREGGRGIHLRGRVGEQIKHVLSAKPKPGRPPPVHARATSDQPWLGIGATRFDDAGATIVLLVPAVPDRPGETLHARVQVTVNDAHSFVVPVTLSVGGPE